MPTIDTGRLNVYYETHGSGDPLLMIAGLASDSQSWMPVMKPLSERFKLILFDNRAVGRTGAEDGPFTIETMAEDCLSLLDKLALENVNILGHSMGGFIAQTLAIHHPARVGKLVLAATAAATSTRNRLLFQYWCHLKQNPGLSAEHWFRELFFWLFTDRFFDDRKTFENSLRFSLEYPYQQTPAQFNAQVEAINGYDILDQLPRISADTLVLSGAEDILIRPAESMQMADNIGGEVTSKIISQAAHSIHFEQTALFCREIIDFLD